MQPRHPVLHPCARGDAVDARDTPAVAATLALRQAQRAFAAAFEAGRRGVSRAPFPRAQRAAAARRTLSGLSADDAARLRRWLSLLLAAAGAADAARRLARIDPALAAGVGAALAGVRDELSRRRHEGAAAA